jgi:hypothetical protein
MVKAVGAIELIAGVGGEVEDTVGQGDPHAPSPWKTLTPSPSPWGEGSKRGVFFFL